jgi:hypothetical protein
MIKELPSTDSTSIQLIKHLMGYVVNGSDSPIKLSQDDATGSYIVTTYNCQNEPQHYYGNDLHDALFLATFGE